MTLSPQVHIKHTHTFSLTVYCKPGYRFLSCGSEAECLIISAILSPCQGRKGSTRPVMLNN